jgi:hypothetical protein
MSRHFHSISRTCQKRAHSIHSLARANIIDDLRGQVSWPGLMVDNRLKTRRMLTQRFDKNSKTAPVNAAGSRLGAS